MFWFNNFYLFFCEFSQGRARHINARLWSEGNPSQQSCQIVFSHIIGIFNLFKFLKEKAPKEEEWSKTVASNLASESSNLIESKKDQDRASFCNTVSICANEHWSSWVKMTMEKNWNSMQLQEEASVGAKNTRL